MSSTSGRRTKPKTSGGQVVSAADAARIMGVERHTVAEWLKRGAPATKDQRGRWTIDMASLISWLIESAVAEIAQEFAGDEDGDGEAPTSLERRGKEIDVALKQYKLAELQGSLCRVDDAIAQAERHFAEVRVTLLAVPPRLSQHLTAEQRDRVEAEIRSALGSLSDVVGLEGDDDEE